MVGGQKDNGEDLKLDTGVIFGCEVDCVVGSDGKGEFSVWNIVIQLRVDVKPDVLSLLLFFYHGVLPLSNSKTVFRDNDAVLVFSSGLDFSNSETIPRDNTNTNGSLGHAGNDGQLVYDWLKSHHHTLHSSGQTRLL